MIPIYQIFYKGFVNLYIYSIIYIYYKGYININKINNKILIYRKPI